MNSILLAIQFVCLAKLFSTGEAADLKETFQAVHLKCSLGTSYSILGIEQLVKLNFVAAQSFRNHDCFEKCVFKTIGTVTSTGLNNDKLLALAEIFQPQTVSQTKIQLVKCASLYNPKNFTCDAAWRLYLCLQNGESALSQSRAPTCPLVLARWNRI